MKMMAVLAAVGLSLCVRGVMGAPIELTVETGVAGARIPGDFLGVSMEMKSLLANEKGGYYFGEGTRKELVGMFKQIGIKNLRVGGNTTDTPGIEVPTGEKIDRLFAFTREAGVKVIYTLRARVAKEIEGEARKDAYVELGRKDGEIAKYVMDHYKGEVMSFEIGNEPNVYERTYEGYRTLFGNITKTVKSAAYAPDAMFCGPNTTPGKVEWVREFAKDFGSSGEINLLTQHAYFGGNSRKVTDQAAARDAMLSKKWLGSYQKMADGIVPIAEQLKLPYRIEETNSYFNGGAKDVSNSFASALWGLDYLYWWASHGASGLNFHTGDKVAAADEQAPCWYALFWTAADGKGFKANPIAYGAKAFAVGSQGTLCPVKWDIGERNMTAYAVKGEDGHLYVTVINKEHGEKAEGATVAVHADGFAGQAEVLTLSVPGNDISKLEGETRGGEAIREDGSWDGKWSEVKGGTVEVGPASAVVVRVGR
ncbi:MAG: hypothetical protein ACTHN5_06305 [Phycisphaerae bacterium]